MAVEEDAMPELSRRMAMLAAIVAGCSAAVPEVWAVVFVLLFNFFAAKKFTSSEYAFKHQSDTHRAMD